ncbi:DUF1194 domain-containing protein [Albimonas sp. CAU 1670]|uniref:DUF1194 domain-containing protein n=1 Tax=Albimonas sp. CAU 1670 TaxID=3032599 RepID=UPI0023DC1843|nr:DUF1194 domain-containing protein [Albimonas sp. CAU 1670]MDF2234411.1 DUF1194 domain-containing protein [Albimonas sp. CAU 1670]
MRNRIRSLLLSLLLPALAAGPSGASAQAGGAVEVDVELILAVDISRSMDIEELQLQRDGYVAALRDPEVIRAIQGGLVGRVALKYFEWAGPGRRGIVSGWVLLDGPEAANAFADDLAVGPITAAVGTSISGAIDYGVAAFEGNGYEGFRRVIDISGDGPNNAGRPVTQARDEAVAQGVVINGLPLMLKANDGPFSLRELDVYYEDCVIGGPLSFVLPLWDSARFAETIRRKLILEIAAPRIVPRPPPSIRAPAGAAAIPAQLGLGPATRAPRINCLIGEERRRRWMEGGGWDW